jgi:hypothetical protein
MNAGTYIASISFNSGDPGYVSLDNVLSVTLDVTG